MNIKKLLMIVSIILITLFGIVGTVSAADANVLDIDLSTNKTSYDSNDEITSTIIITNLSDRYYAENLDIRTNLPDELEIVDENLEIENGQVIWNVDKLERGDSTEITFTTQLKQSNEANEKEASASTEKKDDHDKNIGGSNTESKADEFTAPQTGDESSIIKYVVILITSIIAGIFALFILRKRKLPKIVSFILALLIFAPSLSVVQAQESNVNVQTFTEKHSITIEEETYEFETTVTANIIDGQIKVPVTGTVFDSNGNLVTNEEITFSATVDNESIRQVVETDEEGYFVVRLIENVTYSVEANDLQAQVKASEFNDVEVTNQIGKIELGKTLVNGDNRSSLQSSVIYLSDEVTSQITNISPDLSRARIQGQVDIEANDIIIVPEWEGYPAGIAFEVSSLEMNNGTVTLHLGQPELEDVFEEIIGNIEMDMTEEYFVPAEGVTIIDEPLASLNYYSPLYASRVQPAMSLGGNVTLSLNNLYKSDGFSINGSIDLSGQVTGDIEWRLGLNPVKVFDFNFQGEQRINAEAAISASIDAPDIPLGRFIVPTQIPGLAVSVPFDLVTSAEGKLSVTISTGMRENIGIAYERGSGIRTYPEDKFEPFFNTSDLNGAGKISTGIRMSVLAQALGIDLAGAAATGSISGTVTSSIVGDGGVFQCTTVAGSFDGKMNLRAPIFNDWESDGEISTSKEFAPTTFGNCVSSIDINPNELELSPGEVKSFTVTARDHTNQTPINDDEKLTFEVSDESKVRIEQKSTRVDIIVTDAAQDGDTITVKATFDGKSNITDTLTVKIVDDRESGELVGQVVDAVENDPLHRASIKVYRNDHVVSSIETSEDGTYNARLAPGIYQVEVSHEGYITERSQVEITSAIATTYDSRLQLVGDEYSGIGTVSGQIINAVDGTGIVEATIEIRKGKNQTSGEVVETLTTNEYGYYEVELPGGNYTMALSAEGYITSQANILVIGGKVIDEQNGTLSPVGVIDENLRIILTWGEQPWDLDSHLTGPRADSGRFHIYYGNSDYQDMANNVNLDRDDIDSYGPETVTVINKMQAGTYTYAVHNYTGRYLDEDNQFDLSTSGAKVQIYRENMLLETFNVPVNKSGNSWRVFEIVDGQIIPINQVETIDDWYNEYDFSPIN